MICGTAVYREPGRCYAVAHVQPRRRLGTAPQGIKSGAADQEVPRRREEAISFRRRTSPIGQVLEDVLETGQETEYAVTAISLLVLTGCRLGEILTLKWDYVTPRHLELPDSKTGRRRIPLPREANGIITSLPRRAGNPYVIHGVTDHDHLVNLNSPWLRIRKLAGLEDVRMHDLRQTYASVAVMSGIDPFLLKEIMGHENLQTTLRYSHFADEAVQQAAGSVAGKLAGALGRCSTAPRLRVLN